MRIHQITIFLAFILAGIVLSSVACIYPCSAEQGYYQYHVEIQSSNPAQTNQLQVSVTATPSTISSSSASVQIIVTVRDYQGQAVQGATVNLRADTEGAVVSPSTGTTNSMGTLPSSTLTSVLTGLTVRVTATAHKSTPDMVYDGEGYVNVPVQSGEAQPQAPVYQPPPQPVYQPAPQPQPYQPPPQQPYQPPQPPPQQPATSQQPVAVIIVDQYAVNVKYTVLFDGQKSYAPGGSISTYAWNFGDGSTGGGYVAQHQYTTPGTYTASLVVTDNKGLSSTPATTQITVLSGVEAPVYNVGGTCDDGNKCTINDNYDASGKCVAGQALSCDDNDPGTVDSCDPTAGCIHTPVGQPTAVPTPVPTLATDCMKIIKPGYYTLENDIPAAVPGSGSAACIEILSSGVTFDGKHHKITSGAWKKDMYGIQADGMGISNVFIKDVNVSGWSSGIEFGDITDSSITGCSLHDNKLPANADTGGEPAANVRSRGIYLDSTKRITITNNDIKNNNIGILVSSSQDINIGKLPSCPASGIDTQGGNSGAPQSKTFGNTISDNNWHGIWLTSSDKNHIIGNTITGNGNGDYDYWASGIYSQFSSENEIKLNTITGNLNGIVLSLDSNNNNINGNTLKQNIQNNFEQNKQNTGNSISETPVGKTCEVEAPIMIAKSQVHCTIMGFFSGQCGDWTRIFSILVSHVSPQTTPSGGGGTQQELMNVQGKESQKERDSNNAQLLDDEARTYTINMTSGEVKFGDGSKGERLPSGNDIITANYRTGGGNPLTPGPTITPAPGCPGNLSCKYPLCNCECKDLKNDNANCGACGISCVRGQTCSDGTCVSTARTFGECSHGLTNCNGICVNLKSDPANCGTCGLSCPAGQPCLSGTCIPKEELRSTPTPYQPTPTPYQPTPTPYQG